MKILALNLHSYQEVDQINKFHEIANKMIDLDVDIACFCEASQSLTNHQHKTIEEDNALQIIADRVNQFSKSQYEIRWEFTHYGFAIYEEGLGIITKLPILNVECRFVSKSRNPFDYRSRKIMKVTLMDQNEKVSVYVVHTNIDQDPFDSFEEQFTILQNWIKENTDEKYVLAGDFGIDPSSDNFDRLINQEYVDYYTLINPEGIYDYTFINPLGPEYKSEKKVRLDYILGTSQFKCNDAKILFQEEQVSDHAAVYCELEME